MAVDPRSVKIASPCPTKLDPDRHKGGRKSFYCDHCDKSVHVLSNMTEAEARRLMVEKKGDNICVSYAVRPDGKVRFQQPTPSPAVVPISALSRPRSNRVAAAAAVGFSAALAACTPHERDGVGEKPPVIEDRADEIVDGGLKGVVPDEPVQPADVIVDGEMEAPDEPCEKPKTESEDDVLYDGKMGVEPELEGEPEPGTDEVHKRGEMEAIPHSEPVQDTIPPPGGMVAEPFPE